MPQNDNFIFFFVITDIKKIMTLIYELLNPINALKATLFLVINNKSNNKEFE